MSQIRILPENLANRIAAGEVVERPASVVKELLENSIDAEASRIEVILREGGKKLIEVRDDGAGMSQEDVVVAVQRFATSKIAQDSDLDAIATLGFRGEALPSIGAVCQMKITTRRHDEAEGTALLMEGGEISDLRAVGCPPGTTVQVANLFYNTPARRKFLATTATERGHCVDWVSRLALAHPEIAFQVTHNEAVLVSTPGSGDLASVLAAVYGSNTARQLVPVNLESEGLRIYGHISTPQVTRATRRHQLFFVNRRFVRSRMLSHALTEAYGMLLPQQKQPVAVIMIEIDPGRVDPNVHPTKIEVRFSNPGEVHNLVQHTVENALSEAGLRSLPSTQTRPGEGPGLPAGRLAPVDFQQSSRVKRLRVNPFFDQIDEREDGLDIHAAPAAVAGPAPPKTAAEETDTEGRQLNILGQVSATYLVVGYGNDLLLVDQHRAAERVIFDRLVTQPRRLTRQLLAVPVTLELSPEQAAAAEDHRELLAEMGFEVEPFGGSSYILRSVPAQLTESSPGAVVEAILADLAAWQSSSKMVSLREEMLASISCHAAIKAGQRLSDEEMHKLVVELLATKTPAVCPHGDPIIVSMPADEINRKFHRDARSD